MKFMIVGLVIAIGLCQTKPGSDISNLGPEPFDNPGVGITTWPADQQQATNLTRDAVVAFLTHTGLESMGAVKSESDIYDFRFVPLAPGKLYLIAVVTSGGTFYQMITAIWCDPQSCSHDILYSCPGIDLSTQAVSVSNNGFYQIITELPVGATCREGVTFTINEVGKQGFYDASAKYRDWYKEHLYPKLEEQLNTDPELGISSAEEIASHHAAAQYAMDDYRERVLGIKDAAMEHALEWANSQYTDVQMLAKWAVQYAADSPTVEKVLDALEKSSSPYVREQSFQIRQERAERRAEKQRNQQ